jgi:hypothetical protein
VSGSSGILSQGKAISSHGNISYLSLPFHTNPSPETYSGRVTSIATILLGSIMYTWFKHKEQEQADARKQDSSSSSQTSESNGHKYQKLSRDDHGDDIEMGDREKAKDSTIKSSVG